MSYGAAYEGYCERYGREADLPIATFKRRICHPVTGQLLPDPDGLRRFQVSMQVSKPVAAPGAARFEGLWRLSRLQTRLSNVCICSPTMPQEQQQM